MSRIKGFTTGLRMLVIGLLVESVLGNSSPIWISQDGLEKVVIDSIDKLEKLSGVKVTDLHRHHIDHITIPSNRGSAFGVLEGLMICSSSKHMTETMQRIVVAFDRTTGNHGGLEEEASRMHYVLYLINSPVVRAESLNFKKEGVYTVVKDVFLPWYNAYRFLIQNAKRLEAEGFSVFTPLDRTLLQNSSNVLDQWINSATESLVHFVRREMDAYRLYTVVPYLLRFIDNLTNIYVRFNRKRLKAQGRGGLQDITFNSLPCAFDNMYCNGPFTPFFTETLFQNLRKVSNGLDESIHHCAFPSTSGKRDERIEQSVTRMMTVIDLARNIREQNNKPLKTPLREMIVVHPDAEFLEDITVKLKEYVLEELNIKSILPCNDSLKYTSLRAEPNYSVLGVRLGKAMGSVAKEVKAMTQADILAFERSGEATFSGHCLKFSDIKVLREFQRPPSVTKKEMDASGDGDVLVILDLRADESLYEAGIARENPETKKKAGLEPTDVVEVFYESLNENKNDLDSIVKSKEEYIKEAVGSPLLDHSMISPDAVIICRETIHGVSGFSFAITITGPNIVFDFGSITQLFQGNNKHAEALRTYLLSRDHSKLKSEFQVGKGKIKVECLQGQPVVDVELGKHLFLSIGDYYLNRRMCNWYTATYPNKIPSAVDS
ncbi:hypothetical protein HPP92_011956 [Vanilla planifolia]|uniref:Methionyl/Valyl/Leucyl/Isoleucyl-tRNA synthetase anticodon-binding domain-containing protein n=1 Tax=Vanilla planifolia TaxID=51239 RepID=A0A835RCN2_VANPL|nr:hypothetical protein HPP92_011956 [Vanilla planifolia]